MAEGKKTASKGKHPGGRPPIFKTPEEMQIAIDAYFAECDPHLTEYEYLDEAKGKQTLKTKKFFTHKRPYTMSGLALSLGMTRRALLDYKKKDSFFPHINNARARVERDVEEGMLSSSGVVAGHIFNLKNNFDWKDRQELTGADGSPLMPVSLDGDVLRRRTAKSGGSTRSSKANSEK